MTPHRLLVHRWQPTSGCVGSRCADDFHTQMVRATFKFDNSKTAGTSFLLTRPAADKPGEVDWILVAAAHEFMKRRATTPC